MDHNSLFTLKYSLSKWKELEYRKLVNAYWNCLILSDMFLYGKGDCLVNGWN